MICAVQIHCEPVELSVNRFTICSSPADKAIGIASRLFENPRGRRGTAELEDLDETLKLQMQSAMKQLPARFAIINFSGAADAEDSQRDQYGHSYFRDAPAVSSDLVLMLRDNLVPRTPGKTA